MEAFVFSQAIQNEFSKVEAPEVNVLNDKELEAENP